MLIHILVLIHECWRKALDICPREKEVTRGQGTHFRDQNGAVALHSAGIPGIGEFSLDFTGVLMILHEFASCIQDGSVFIFFPGQTLIKNTVHILVFRLSILGCGDWASVQFPRNMDEQAVLTFSFQAWWTPQPVLTLATVVNQVWSFNLGWIGTKWWWWSWYDHDDIVYAYVYMLYVYILMFLSCMTPATHRPCHGIFVVTAQPPGPWSLGSCLFGSWGRCGNCGVRSSCLIMTFLVNFWIVEHVWSIFAHFNCWTFNAFWFFWVSLMSCPGSVSKKKLQRCRARRLASSSAESNQSQRHKAKDQGRRRPAVTGLTVVKLSSGNGQMILEMPRWGMQNRSKSTSVLRFDG